MQNHIICQSWAATNVTRHFCELWELRMTKLSILELRAESEQTLTRNNSQQGKTNALFLRLRKMVSALIKFSNFESKM